MSDTPLLSLNKLQDFSPSHLSDSWIIFYLFIFFEPLHCSRTVLSSWDAANGTEKAAALQEPVLTVGGDGRSAGTWRRWVRTVGAQRQNRPGAKGVGACSEWAQQSGKSSNTTRGLQPEFWEKNKLLLVGDRGGRWEEKQCRGTNGKNKKKSRV